MLRRLLRCLGWWLIDVAAPPPQKELVEFGRDLRKLDEQKLVYGGILRADDVNFIDYRKRQDNGTSEPEKW